jgi:hypothetical protein
MMHIDEGSLRALIDGELPEAEGIKVREHLGACPNCRELFESVRTRAGRIQDHFASLEISAKQLPVQDALQRFQAQFEQKETGMLTRLFQKKYRLAWTTAMIVGVLAISMLFPQVQALAGRLLSLFRVEQIQPIEIGLTLGMLPDYMEGYFRSFEVLLGDQIEIGEVFEPREVQGVSEASRLAGFDVRLPDEMEGEPQLIYLAARTVHYELEHELLQGMLNEMGHGDLVIPQSVDGKQVTIHLPDTVIGLYGDCGVEGDGTQTQSGGGTSCTAFVQARSPTVDVPPELDLDRLGQIFLQVLGMSEEDASEFSAKVDWLTTLVLPIPADAQYEEIPSVDGVPGVLVKDPVSETKARYTLLWIKSGILHGLMGVDTPEHAVRVANSLR